MSPAQAACGSLLERVMLAQAGDRALEEQLLEENAPLIWSIVRRFTGRGVEAEDLFQLGSIGMLKAIQGYDPAFGTQFSTYAVPKIMGEIKRFLRDDGMIKVSRGLKENAAKIYAARERLEKEGREARLSDLSELTGLEESEIASCEQASTVAVSLDAPVGDDGCSLGDLMGQDGPEEGLVERIALRSALAALPEQERAVLALRFYRDLTQQKTADLLGISQVQVSRLERRAIERIKKLMDDT